MAALNNSNKVPAPVSSSNENPIVASSDHTYSSPKPQPIPGNNLAVKPTSDHTYTENSDVPTEPYGSDNENRTDNV